MSAFHLTVEPQDELIQWAADQLDASPEGWWPDREAMAVREGDRIRAVMVMEQKINRNCVLHFASDGSRRWAIDRRILGGLFSYLFIFKRLHRVTLVPPEDRIDAQCAALKLGFVFEGRLQAGAHDGSDVIVMGMTADKCRWIRKDEGHG